jgi:hypothetical protein
MKINIFASSRYFMFNLSENFSHNATVFQKSKMPTQYLPSPSPPHWAVHGVGEKWLFSATSGGFGYGYEAVRIRVLKKLV